MRRPVPVRRPRRGLWARIRGLSLRSWILIGLLVAGGVGAFLYFGGTAEDEIVRRQRDDSRRFAHAEQRLRAEPNVANVVYAQERGSWNVELPPGATVAKGFAAYLCTVLAGEEMIDKRTSVRTVDTLKLAESQFDYEAATIEHVRCRAIVPDTVK